MVAQSLPNFVTPHLGLAALKMVYYLDCVGAEKEAKRGIDLNPGFDEIHYAYSFLLVVMRRFNEAIAEGKRALACNPFSIRISQHLGYALYCSRNYGEAIRQYERTLELDPNDASVHESLGDMYARNGQYRKAGEHWKQAMILAKDEELAATLCMVNGKEPFGSARARSHPQET